MKFRILTAIVTWALIAPPALACSIIFPPIEEQANRVASQGTVISGTVIQAFDPVKKRPEIIRADTIYIGDGEPRDFIIHRTQQDYDIAIALSTGPVTSCGKPPTLPKVGQYIYRITLYPHPESENQRWRFGGIDQLSSEKGIDLIVETATRYGRFRARPPETQVAP